MQRAIIKRIRVKKEDSAFVYFTLESNEGVTMYSTLDHRNGDLYRDLELLIAPDFAQECDQILSDLGSMIYPLEEGNHHEAPSSS